MQTKPIPLWSELINENTQIEDVPDEKGWLHNVSNPSVVPFLPPAEIANNTGILIAPGGSYRILDWVSHVERLAHFFNPLGYAVIGLKYRTCLSSNPVPTDALADLHRGISIVNSHAKEWHVDPERLVGLGYSAGSNLLLNHSCSNAEVYANGDKISYLPYMALLCLWPHDKGAEEYNISSKVPNVFLCTTEEDEVAPISFTHAIEEKMKQVGVNTTTQSYPKGGHNAFNFKENGPKVDWTPAFLKWLRGHGLY
jgi:acetyl esterase/lipase